jgi:phosphotransacetylase
VDLATAVNSMAAVLTKSWLRAIGDRPIRVVLADGTDPRSAEAARQLADTTPIVAILADHSYVAELRTKPPIVAALSQALAGRTPLERRRLARSALYVAAAAVRTGLADACVGGSQLPTAEVVRAGLRVLGTAPGVQTVTSSFLMGLNDGSVVAYADCAVVPEPDHAQLAEIAIATSRTFADLTGAEPVVAMLSFSTKGSAKHHRVDSVRAAVELIRKWAPALEVDGELQFDAAFAADVGARKAAGSAVPGRANVFVFPSLEAANIAYKITERLAGATAIGPLLQGLAAPMNDLSRGCSPADIVAVALASAVQALRQAPCAIQSSTDIAAR